MSNKRYLYLSRRQVIRGLLATTAFGVSAKFGTGCSSATTNSAEGKSLTMGFIYVGAKDDYGYNQAHAQGAQDAAKIPGVT